MLLQTGDISNYAVNEEFPNDLIERYIKIFQRPSEIRGKYKQFDIWYKTLLMQDNVLFCLLKRIQSGAKYQYEVFRIEFNGYDVTVDLEVFGCVASANKVKGSYGGKIKQWKAPNFLLMNEMEKMSFIANMGNYVVRNMMTVDVFAENLESTKYSRDIIEISSVPCLKME